MVVTPECQILQQSREDEDWEKIIVFKCGKVFVDPLLLYDGEYIEDGKRGEKLRIKNWVNWYSAFYYSWIIPKRKRK